MKTVVCVLLLVSFSAFTREGKTVFQERAERAAQRERCDPVCRIACNPVVCAAEAKDDGISQEQRDLMREHGLSVPPVILGLDKKEKALPPIFSAAEPIREIKIEVEAPKKIELPAKKDPPKAEIVEEKKIETMAKKIDSGPTQEQRDLMREHGLSVPPTIVSEKKLPDIANAPKEIPIQVDTPKLSIQDLTDANFESKIANGDCLVVFGATWCGPCRRLDSIIHLLANEYGLKISFFHVDVDSCPQTKSQQHISSYPTMNLYRNGNRIDTRVGYMEKEAIEAWLNQHK